MQVQDNIILNNVMSGAEEPLDQWLSVRGIQLTKAPERIYYADTADDNTYQEAEYKGSFRVKWAYWIIYQYNDSTNVYISLKPQSSDPSETFGFPVLEIHRITMLGDQEWVNGKPELLKHYSQTNNGAAYKLELKRGKAIVRIGDEAVKISSWHQMSL